MMRVFACSFVLLPLLIQCETVSSVIALQHVHPPIRKRLFFATCGGGVSQEFSEPAFSTVSSAISYVRECLRNLHSEIRIELQCENVIHEASALGRLLQDTENLTESITCTVEGNRVIYKPQYADDVLILRAYEQPKYVGQLSVRQQQALARARQILASTSRASSAYERALMLHDAIVVHAAYRSRAASGEGEVGATTDLLLDSHGVCVAYTRTYRLLLSMAGIPNLYVSGSSRGVGHCWNMVQLDGQWVHIDCTYDDPAPDVPGRSIHTYFALSSKMLQRSHSWDISSYPVANSSSLYYPLNRGMRFASVKELLIWCQNTPHPSGSMIEAYVDELSGVQSFGEVKELLNFAQMSVRSNVLRSFSWDKGTPESIICFYL